ncbi:MYXO-CTERM sorting domain-containing protein [Congregibacter litoralis]|uniref:PEP-CTERM protein sorting domain protein n=1 Tax=Congregibacter litoralis KT71 TaxID=314285 RepID=A4A8W6_9GAMM|nr:MYXO-CTERM sorting domain-containing protein [Congregibacter litoralis]EAQ97508.2 PEP-CTERM protein sorting domain protein [Congregibacter litoralis KT71]
MRYTQLVAGLTIAAFSGLANAGLVIDSINVQMVSTEYSARDLGGDNGDRYDAALDAFNSSEGEVCSKDLEAFEGISYRKTCNGTREDYGALYTINGSLSGSVEFEFGLDWGLGGFILADYEDAPIDYYNTDIWWSKNWNNSDVLSYEFSDVGSFSLTLLGFEGCCDGINSARYRTFETSQTARTTGQTSTEWQTLRVNAVPVPGSLPLMAVGALLLLRRRQQS